eukprot:gnl/TRDRNA2_/TRDRNA2_164730_c4_seq10.p1 gnl/TRDRNA2_/TRDRNA2_164730_c4~~gnl/TRDRNA2_/TRDRNA2_164730_c4_seq10.p1  ORF type:complete len:777 (+),score=146.72 gnl/TRDRNA2_/TRDRNA2_164730_c4_seq10:221-2332(+)
MHAVPPPHPSVDVLSSEDNRENCASSLSAAFPSSPAWARQTSHHFSQGETGRADSPLGARKMPQPLRQSHKAGGTKSRQRNSGSAASQRDGDGRTVGEEQQRCIFTRHDLQPTDWTSELEHVFRRQVANALTDYIKKNFQKSPPSLRDGQTSPDATASARGGSPALKPVSANGGSPVTLSLASAFPGMPSDIEFELREEEGDPPPPVEVFPALRASSTQTGGRAPYVPPHRRSRAATGDLGGGPIAEATAEEEASSRGGADPFVSASPSSATVTPAAASEASPAAASAAPVEEKPRAKWVPSFLRRKMEEEAAAAAAAAASEGGGGSAEAPSSEPSSAGTGTVSAAATGGHQPKVLPTDESGSGGDGRYGYCVNQGPRKGMEDAVHAEFRFDASGPVPLELYAVYDGHSGTAAVDFVRQRLPSAIRGCRCFSEPGRLNEALAEAFVTTDEELLVQLKQQPVPPRPDPAEESGRDDGSDYLLSSGSVACVAIVRGTTIHIANLGDCRAVLCCDGEMKPLTVDHHPHDNEIERERLQKLGVSWSCDGYLHGRIAVSRAFGDWAIYAEEKCKGLTCLPDVSEVEITADAEFLLIGCDGIFEKMSSKEAGQIVRRSLRSQGDPKAASESLVKNALKSNGSDNLSAVVVMFKRPPGGPVGDASRPRLFGRRPAATLEALAAATPSADATSPAEVSVPAPDAAGAAVSS